MSITLIFFQFLNWSYKNLSACLSKSGVFIRNWPVCFEKVSFLYAVLNVILTISFLKKIIDLSKYQNSKYIKKISILFNEFVELLVLYIIYSIYRASHKNVYKDNHVYFKIQI